MGSYGPRTLSESVNPSPAGRPAILQISQTLGSGGRSASCRRLVGVRPLSHTRCTAALRTRIPLNARQKFSGITAQYSIGSVHMCAAVATHRSPAASPADVPNPVNPFPAPASKLPLVAATPNSPR